MILKLARDECINKLSATSEPYSHAYVALDGRLNSVCIGGFHERCLRQLDLHVYAFKQFMLAGPHPGAPYTLLSIQIIFHAPVSR